MTFPGSEELSGDMSRICTGSSSAAAAWVYQQRCTSQSSVYLPKSTGRVGERRYALCLVSFLEPQPGDLQDTHFGCSSVQKPWAAHTGTVLCTAQRVALQMFTIHGLWSWVCSQHPGLAGWHRLTHQEQRVLTGQRDGVTSVRNPRSCGLCGLLCLKAAAQSSFQVRLLPFSPTWLLLKGENRGFLVPKQQQSWWPQSNAPPKPELAPIFLTCLAMIYPTAFPCNAVWVWSSAALPYVTPRAELCVIPEDTFPVVAGKCTISV